MDASGNTIFLSDASGNHLEDFYLKDSNGTEQLVELSDGQLLIGGVPFDWTDPRPSGVSHRVHLGRTDRSQEGDDVRLGGELRERQHDSGIGGLIVLDDQFDLLAENASGFVDLLRQHVERPGLGLPPHGSAAGEGDRVAYFDDVGRKRRYGKDEQKQYSKQRKTLFHISSYLLVMCFVIPRAGAVHPREARFTDSRLFPQRFFSGPTSVYKFRNQFYRKCSGRDSPRIRSS